MLERQVVLFLKSFIGQSVVYFVVVSLLFAVVWRWGASRLRGARIQPRRRFDGRQLRHELRHTLVTLAVGAGNATLLMTLYAAGRTKLQTDAAAWSWPAIVLCFLGLLLLNDAWFYAWHRLLHHRRVFRLVHAVHHRSIDVNPFSSYSFHAVEALLLGGWVVPAALLVPIYLPVLAALQVVGLANNVMSHLGYELLPRWYIRIPPFRWMNTATFHSLHHTKFHANYGLMFRFWDRLLGTEAPEYEEAFLTRGGAAPAPPTPAC